MIKSPRNDIYIKMKNKKPTYDPYISLDMPFEEAMKRLSKVEKEKVDTNIKRHNSKKK